VEAVRLDVYFGERSTSQLFLFSIAAYRLLRLLPLEEGAGLGNHLVIKIGLVAKR